MKYFCFGFMILTLTAFSPVFAQEKTDVADSKDHPAISRLKGSVIEFYQETKWGTYKLPLDDKGKISFTEPRKLEGKVTRIQYSSSKDNNPEFVLSNYKAAFKASGFTILTALANDELGVGERSQDWNGKYYFSGIFNSPGLNSSKFGLRHHIPNWKLNQAFIAASGNVDGTDVFITVYAVDHDSYTLINQDVIEVGSAETGLVTVDKISKGLAATGHIAIYDIYFDIGKDTVKPTSDSALKTIADYMNSQKEMKFFIVGHTDNTGLYTNNLTLSRNRAKTVMNLLVSKFGVSESQLDADGVASLAPVASNKEEVGREKNRRVEIVLQ